MSTIWQCYRMADIRFCSALMLHSAVKKVQNGLKTNIFLSAALSAVISSHLWLPLFFLTPSIPYLLPLFLLCLWLLPLDRVSVDVYGALFSSWWSLSLGVSISHLPWWMAARRARTDTCVLDHGGMREEGGGVPVHPPSPWLLCRSGLRSDTLRQDTLQIGLRLVAAGVDYKSHSRLIGQ